MADKNSKSNEGLLYDRARLLIMTALVAAKEALSFNELLEASGLTKGNLSSHLQKLEAEQFVKIKKQFVDKKPQTTIEISAKGKQALKEHVQSLSEIIKSMKI